MKSFAKISLISSLVVPVLFSCNSKQDNFDKMSDAYKTYLVDNTKTADYDNITKEDLFNQFDTVQIGGVDTYKFKNIDYTYDLNKSSWPASGHLGNTLKIAISWYKQKDKKEKSFLKDAALGLTYHWVYSYYKNANWWMNDLSANQNLTSVGLFLYDDLSPKGQAAFRGKTHYASLYYAPEKATHTGGNLFNYVDLTLKDGIATRNPDEVQFAMTRLDEEITDENVEGFQKDGSFFQHGREIQSLSYGDTVNNIGRMLSIANKGGYGINESKLEIISKWINRGVKSLIHNGYMNGFGLSREYSRPNAVSTDSKSFKNLKFYLDIDAFPNKEELRTFLTNIENKGQVMQNGEMQYFDVAKYASEVVDGVYFSYRGSEPKLGNTECVNHENKLGLNLSYATNTTIMEKGDEYYNLSPLMEYDHVPGTTSWQIEEGGAKKVYDEDLKKEMWVQVKDETLNSIVQTKELYDDGLYGQHLPEATDQNGYVYSSKFDETNKISVFAIKSNHHRENKFTVTGILYKDGLINIGSEIEYTGEVTEGEGKPFAKDSRKLHTTLQQCMLRDEDIFKFKGTSVKHNNVIYTSLDPSNTLNISVQTFGTSDHRNWYRNNPTYHQDDYNDVTGTIGIISIDHNKAKDVKYAYVARPESRTGAEYDVTLIQNSDGIHAVKLPDNKKVIVFYKDGTFTVDGKEYKDVKRGDIVIE